MTKYLSLAVCALVLSVGAQARIWGDYIIGGNACNYGNVQVLESGDNLSILFDEFGVNMPLGSYGEGTSVRKTCNFRITLTPPSGMYLAGFKQVYSGGLIKSRRSSAQLSVRYNLGALVANPLPIKWSSSQAITPDDPASLYTRTFNNPLLVANCGGSTIYGINMTLTGLRPNVSTDFLVGGLDSVEAEFTQKLILVPEWKMCRR